MQHLNESELQELSRFFARRFPGTTARLPLAMAAGLNFEESGDARMAWLSLLRVAQSEGRLGTLATLAARTLRSDDNLQEVCALLGASPPRPLAAPLAVLSGMACAVLVFLLLLSQRGSSPFGVPAPSAPTSAASLVSAGATPIPPPSSLISYPPPPSAATVAAVRTPSSPAPSSSSASLSLPTTAPEQMDAAPERRYREGCVAPPGELVGYFYTGTTHLGRSGETIRIPETVRVRADFPDFRNNHNAQAPVQCVLRQGQTLRLSADPILVPGERYWVPVYGGDVR